MAEGRAIAGHPGPTRIAAAPDGGPRLPARRGRWSAAIAAAGASGTSGRTSPTPRSCSASDPAQGLPAAPAGSEPGPRADAYLTEEAGFAAVPPLAGFAELVSRPARRRTTVAIAQAFVADGADAYESIAEALTAWILAPGEVTVEFATEVAADLGTLTAGMHAALAAARACRTSSRATATRAEIDGVGDRRRAQHLDGAVAVVDRRRGHAVLRELAPRIAEEFDASSRRCAGTPLLTRVHGDYHLGQILIAPDGYRIIDFEGEPLGRSTSGARSLAAARRGLDAAVARSCRPERRAPGRASATAARSSRRGSTSTAGCAGRASASSTRIGRASASPARRSSSTRRSCARSRSTRSSTSSSTRRPTCRRGCGRRPRACAACSTDAA